MAVTITHLDIISPLDLDGASGEWRYDYATVPTAYGDWPTAIDAVIEASPYDTNAKAKAWAYVQLYSAAQGQTSSSVQSFSFGAASINVGESNRFNPNSRLAYWQQRLNDLTTPYLSSSSVPVVVKL